MIALMKNKVTWVANYIKDIDTLILRSEPNEPAINYDCNGDFWVRVAPDGRVAGIEIEDFRSSFVKKVLKGKL